MNRLLPGLLEYSFLEYDRQYSNSSRRSSLYNRVKTAVTVLILLAPTMLWAAEYEAVVDWNRKSKLSTPVSGVVAKVHVQPGNRAKQGDVLLQLDNAVIKANVEQAKAALQRSERLYQEAQRELERHQELYDRTVLSDHELEVAHIAFEQANAELKSAQAALAQAEFDFRHSEIRAPFDGIVVQRFVNEGETIASQDTPPVLIEFAEVGIMIAQFHVKGEQLSRFKNGKKASVNVGGAAYAGQVVAVGFEPVSKSSNKYLVKVSFDTKGKILRAGRAAKVNIR